MLFQRLLHGPALLALATALAMGIMLAGGCPQQHIPSPPPTQPDDDETPPVDPGTGQQDRPIPSPDIDEPDQPPIDDEPDDEPGGGTQPGGDPATGWSVRFTAPTAAIAARPGTLVHVVFNLSDFQGVISQAELVLARDANGDGKPDGAPVAAKPIAVAAGNNKVTYNSADATGLLTDGFGQFVIGVRVTTNQGAKQTLYAPGRLTIDAVPPTATWVGPTDDAVTGPTTWTVRLQTNDNSKHTVQVLLDNDTDPNNGFAGILVESTEFAAGDGLRVFNKPLSISSGTYYYYVVVSDGIDPPTAFYAPNLQQGGLLRVLLTRRIIGTYNLNTLDPASAMYNNFGAKSKGAIFQGFNFNDLAGSSMVGVPDVTGNGVSELLIGARFGKPHTGGVAGIGYGEAYLFYGQPARLRGTFDVNSIADGSMPGLILPGIRAPLGTTWTEGLADITVVPDMDGDGRPELVFGFPRVESLSLWNTSSYQPVQPDTFGMGTLEYDAYYNGQWNINEAQFTRGGIVIVSSQDRLLRNATARNRKGDRVLDLAEVGQMFTAMGRPNYVLRISDTVQTPRPPAMCGDPPNETTYEDWTIFWDYIFENQGPGGFDNYFTDTRFGRLANPNQPTSYEADPHQPPLARIRSLPYRLDDLNVLVLPNNDPCAEGNCVVKNEWRVWGRCPTPFPTVYGTALLCSNPSWHASLTGQESGQAVWTGFYPSSFLGGDTAVSPLRDEMVGARILGQRREDRFGASIGADGRWLYVSAPQRSATLVASGQQVTLTQCGMVYGVRTQAYLDATNITRTQLWIEPGQREIPPTEPGGDPTIVRLAHPYIDAQFPDRQDWTMPVPHQYIIGTVGSTRGRDIFWPATGREPVSEDPDSRLGRYEAEIDGCIGERVPEWLRTVVGGMPANTIGSSGTWNNYNPGRSTYYVDDRNLVHIVGPHAGARIATVRGLGDVNRDGIPDFVVGSGEVRERFSNPLSPSGNKVGAVFIVYGRPFGVELDYLLHTMVLPENDPSRLRGVVLRGTTADEQLGRVFDHAGDFDRNGAADVIVGAEGYDNNRGRAVLILGSSTLSSPQDGWVADDIVAAGRGIIFRGAAPGDRAGANVAGAGDVDGDGYDDILIAAPGAEGGRGAVYLIYGAPGLVGREISLADIGTINLPGAKFIGRAVGDELGGGRIRFPDDRPGVYLNPNAHSSVVYSRGVVTLGDIDGDGLADFAISAIFANPNNRNDAGEVYVIYGVAD